MEAVGRGIPGELQGSSATGDGGHRFVSWSAYDIVRILFGIILIVAALLKAHQIATDLPLQAGLRGAVWPKILLVEFELAFGLWLLFNLYPQRTRLAAMGLALVFAGAALYRWVTGEASCGCFGQVHVHPAVTSSMDVAFAVALWIFRPQLRQGTGGAADGILRSERSPSGLRWAVYLCALLTLTIWMASEAGALGRRGRANAGVRVVDPATWMGKRFPLSGDLRPLASEKVDIGSGQWVLAFFHRDCGKCREVLSALARSSGESSRNGEVTRYLTIEVPRYAGERAEQGRPGLACEQAQLDSDVEWFVQTPLVVWLSDGRVTQVSHHFP